MKAREADEEVDLLALVAEECARYEAVEASGEPVAVRGDPRLLRRIVRNLLENARRPGAPPIEVRVTHAEGRVELRVCDHGPGIPDTERDRVFQPFHRFVGAGDSAAAGLGLSLVQQIARQYDGDARYLRSQET